jgi:predicted HD superfamily hydrolase involved in NAD metabolism
VGCAPASEVNVSALLADTIQSLTDRARRALDQRRLLHLLGVAHTAATLAQTHGLDVGRAVLAGLLHDLSKPIDPEDIERDLTAWGVAIPEEDRDYPRIWHGLHAAVWAGRELGLDAPEIHEAVMLHTTADAGVGPLTRALFIADLAEPLRRVDEAPAILALARRDLTAGFRLALRVKVAHVRGKGRPIHPRARRALLDFPPQEEAEGLPAVGG